MDLERVAWHAGELVACWEAEGERREVAVLERPEGALVCSRTSGELTREAYGAPWHVGCVCVRREHVGHLACVLAPEEPGVARAARRFFASGEVHFSDLLDALDAAGVPYAYRAFEPEAVAYRPEACVA